jgi:hypothetical protein
MDRALGGMTLGVLKIGLLSCSLLKDGFAPTSGRNADDIAEGPSPPTGGQLVGPFNRPETLNPIKDYPKCEAHIAHSNVVLRLLGARE